jgi:hypothetical protein
MYSVIFAGCTLRPISPLDERSQWTEWRWGTLVAPAVRLARDSATSRYSHATCSSRSVQVATESTHTIQQYHHKGDQETLWVSNTTLCCSCKTKSNNNQPNHDLTGEGVVTSSRPSSGSRPWIRAWKGIALTENHKPRLADGSLTLPASVETLVERQVIGMNLQQLELRCTSTTPLHP